MRRRWQAIERLKQFRHNPLAPLVYVGLIGIVAYVVFFVNWLTHPW